MAFDGAALDSRIEADHIGLDLQARHPSTTYLQAQHSWLQANSSVCAARVAVLSRMRIVTQINDLIVSWTTTTSAPARPALRRVAKVHLAIPPLGLCPMSVKKTESTKTRYPLPFHPLCFRRQHLIMVCGAASNISTNRMTTGRPWRHGHK